MEHLGASNRDGSPFEFPASRKSGRWRHSNQPFFSLHRNYRGRYEHCSEKRLIELTPSFWPVAVFGNKLVGSSPIDAPLVASLLTVMFYPKQAQKDRISVGASWSIPNDALLVVSLLTVMFSRNQTQNDCIRVGASWGIPKDAPLPLSLLTVIFSRNQTQNDGISIGAS